MSTLLLTDARPRWKRPMRKVRRGTAIVRITSRCKVGTMFSDAATSGSVREIWRHILWEDFLWTGRPPRGSGTGIDETGDAWVV